MTAYENVIKNIDGSQHFEDWNIFQKIKDSASIYAQDVNNCYSEHTYQIKKGNILVEVTQEEFQDYLMSSAFNSNFCESAVQLTKSGPSPVFIKNNFCTR